ncbi:nascent polypeptide-associated complex subunit alpha, muscle-specific form-like [Eubalaena glacialis]|uniref:nascent polypeptide-associated complex subunit alpha, muscle-specific form-like n=1 Tax=Eubalaena glacialis TaxID=27606 RepID=UPI002A5AA1A1|nr:nascent polypeptide-associated complex subunit alpha, muscle-specific form-like [Eubalaena glacialis]
MCCQRDPLQEVVRPTPEGQTGPRTHRAPAPSGPRAGYNTHDPGDEGPVRKSYGGLGRSQACTPKGNPGLPLALLVRGAWRRAHLGTRGQSALHFGFSPEQREVTPPTRETENQPRGENTPASPVSAEKAPAAVLPWLLARRLEPGASATPLCDPAHAAQPLWASAAAPVQQGPAGPPPPSSQPLVHSSTRAAAGTSCPDPGGLGSCRRTSEGSGGSCSPFPSRAEGLGQPLRQLFSGPGRLPGGEGAIPAASLTVDSDGSGGRKRSARRLPATPRPPLSAPDPPEGALTSPLTPRASLSSPAAFPPLSGLSCCLLATHRAQQERNLDPHTTKRREAVLSGQEGRLPGSGSASPPTSLGQVLHPVPPLRGLGVKIKRDDALHKEPGAQYRLAPSVAERKKLTQAAASWERARLGIHTDPCSGAAVAPGAQSPPEWRDHPIPGPPRAQDRTLFISLSLVSSIGNGSETASVHTRCGSLFRLITPPQACPTPRDRGALISTNWGVPLYGRGWELGFRSAVRRPGGLGTAIGPGHRPCPAPRATRCLTLAHHFPSGARASCPPPAQGRMNEPPAGRNARNYRPDQRPHAARPGRQRDRVPLKGDRNGGRPGATNGPPGAAVSGQAGWARAASSPTGASTSPGSHHRFRPRPAGKAREDAFARRSGPARAPASGALPGAAHAHSPGAFPAAPPGAPAPPRVTGRAPTHAPPAARTRTRPPSRARLPPPRPPPRPQPGALRRAPTRPQAHAPRPRALPSPPRSRCRRAALLLLSPPSRMVAAAAAATQTPGSGGRAPRPEEGEPGDPLAAAPPQLYGAERAPQGATSGCV